MPQSSLSKNRILIYFLAFIPFAWGFWTFHHYEVMSKFTLMQGPTDPQQHIFQFENYFQALLGHTSVVSPPIFYPTKGVLGYCDAMAGAAPIYCSFRLLRLDMYNATLATVLVFNIFNFLACFWFLKKGFNLKTFPSSIGAAFFTFNSIKYNQLEHYDFQALYFLPIILLCFVLFIRRSSQTSEKIKILWLAAVLIDVQLLTSFYMGWFLAIWGIALLFMFLIFEHKDFFSRSWKVVFPPSRFSYGVALFILVVGLIPFLALYLPVLHLKGPRPLPDVINNMPTLKALMWMSDKNYVWGWLSHFNSFANMDCEWENRLGLGLLFSLFWLWVTVKAVRNIPNLTHKKAPGFPFEKDSQAQSQSVFETLVILSVWFCVLLILKRHGQPILWQWIYNWVPGGKAVLCTSRFGVVLMLPVSMIFAFEVQRWIGCFSTIKEPVKKIGAIALMGAALSGIWFEQMGESPCGVISVTNARNDTMRLAKLIPKDATAFYISGTPGDSYFADRGECQTGAMLIAIVSGVPTLNGYYTSGPPGWNLRGIDQPDYQEIVAQWISDHRLGNKVFDLKLKRENGN
ncbi:MAG TPA: hypothetical protein VK791_02865 [bacterium]|jgi:hypothetical protein|nr:hypothetical protein [bacterium]